MGTFTPELTFGEYSYGTMAEDPGISYKTLIYGSFSPLSLFAASEPGLWYDPSDLSTLFQDTAGTTPVTAAGQSVGRILDKSGRGNHATQSTSLSRPTLGRNPSSGTRNLLTYTEQFDNAAWVKLNATITANAVVSPDGTADADKLVESTGTGSHRVNPTGAISLTSGTTYTATVYAKSGGRTRCAIITYTGATDITSVFDLSAGSVVSGPGTITAVGGGWYRLSQTYTAAATLATIYAFQVALNDGSSNSYTGDGTSGAFIWGAQLELGSTATAYQKVVSSFDVTEADKADCWYLGFDGSDDFLVTPTITPGTDKAQVFAGVRKLSDAADGVVVETGTGSSAGRILLAAPWDAGFSRYLFRSVGTATAGAITSSTTFNAPNTSVITGIGDIAADTAILRVNGAQAASSTSDQGTGNFLAYPAYIGRRGGTSLPFNGRIYSLICRFGSNLTADQITQTEAWVNSKTGAY